MEFTGKLILELPEEGGTSQRGNQWRKKGWVLETFGQYPKKVKVDAFNNAIDNIHMTPGKTYTVSVDAESREFNGRWYTDLRIYACREAQDPQPNYTQGVTPAAPAAPAANPFAAAPAAPADPFASAAAGFKDEGDDLPF